jgi:hypothetical protein
MSLFESIVAHALLRAASALMPTPGLSEMYTIGITLPSYCCQTCHALGRFQPG